MPRQDSLKFLTDGRYIAHRGFHNQQFPENSMGAFELAIANNFHIEFDLHLSKDKQLVIFHDDDMERMTGISGKIEDYDYEYLKTLKLGSSEQTIPLLDDLLNLVNGKVGLVIEIKTYKPNNDLLCKLLVDRLKEYEGDYVVQSFDPTIVATIRQLDRTIIRGQLVCGFEDNKDMKKSTKFLLKNLMLNIIARPDFINTEYRYYTKKINRIHRYKPVICWTIRSKDQQRLAHFYDNIIFERFDPRGKDYAK